MSLSKGFGLLKTLKNSPRFNNSVRHGGHGPSHIYYRKSGIADIPKWALYARDGLIGFSVWWILWHFWHEPGHIFGEQEYPDPTKWTDAELGIPPDEE